MCSNTSARISASIRLDQIEMPDGPACESIVRRAFVRYANASTDERALSCVVSRTRTVRVVPGAAGRIRRDRMTDREAACGYVVLCVMCVRAGEIPTRPHGMHPSSYARVKLPRAGRPARRDPSIYVPTRSGPVKRPSRTMLAACFSFSPRH